MQLIQFPEIRSKVNRLLTTLKGIALILGKTDEADPGISFAILLTAGDSPSQSLLAVEPTARGENDIRTIATRHGCP